MKLFKIGYTLLCAITFLSFGLWVCGGMYFSMSHTHQDIYDVVIYRTTYLGIHTFVIVSIVALLLFIVFYFDKDERLDKLTVKQNIILFITTILLLLITLTTMVVCTIENYMEHNYNKTFMLDRERTLNRYINDKAESQLETTRTIERKKENAKHDQQLQDEIDKRIEQEVNKNQNKENGER